MSSARMIELQNQINAAEKAIWAEHARSGGAPTDPHGPDGFRGEAFRKAAEARRKARESALDLLLAKKANLSAGLAEDFGLDPPINLELIVRAQLSEIQSAWRQEFIEFREAMLTAVAHATVQQVSSGLKEIGDRVGLIESYGVRYLGVWQRQATYEAGSLVTSRGSMWHANEDSTGVEPGTGAAWTLAVKAGRDGKDKQ